MTSFCFQPLKAGHFLLPLAIVGRSSQACGDCRPALTITLKKDERSGASGRRWSAPCQSASLRQRVYFERKENLNKAAIHPYPFSHLEYRKHSRLLVSNWGKKRGMDGDGEMFELCPSCGKHRPAHMTSRETERCDEDHAKRCNGRPRAYVLGYEFSADALVLPVAKRLIPDDETQAFCRTLGTALVAGAAELLEGGWY